MSAAKILVKLMSAGWNLPESRPGKMLFVNRKIVQPALLHHQDSDKKTKAFCYQFSVRNPGERLDQFFVGFKVFFRPTIIKKISLA
jgi:hypothetical protein